MKIFEYAFFLEANSADLKVLILTKVCVENNEGIKWIKVSTIYLHKFLILTIFFIKKVIEY